jgi:hypothetical protein
LHANILRRCRAILLSRHAAQVPPLTKAKKRPAQQAV